MTARPNDGGALAAFVAAYRERIDALRRERPADFDEVRVSMPARDLLRLVGASEQLLETRRVGSDFGNRKTKEAHHGIQA